MKTIFKLIGGLLTGIVAGFAIAALITVIFTDTTLPQFIDQLLSIKLREGAVAAFVGVLAFILAIAILIPVHEAGHLVCGLLSGYQFVSFRIFNLTFIKADGKLRVKQFAVAGTGGQCLLTPPDLPLERIPTVWYNAGGVLANLIILLLALPLFFLNLHPYVGEALFIFCLADVFLILMNGIPMKLNGLGNDGYNIIYLNRNLLSKQAMVTQLRANALIQNGMRPGDMPDEWFWPNCAINYRNPLEVSVPLMHSSRLIDLLQWEEAYEEFSELYKHKKDMSQLHINEIACESAFCALVTGRRQQAEELLDSRLKIYIDAYKKTMSSKQRLSCAIALYIEGDRNKAEDIYQTLSDNREKYLLQGEVKSDLAIMEWILL